MVRHSKELFTTFTVAVSFTTMPHYLTTLDDPMTERTPLRTHGDQTTMSRTQQTLHDVELYSSTYFDACRTIMGKAM